ncbi:PAS domain S-box protein [Fulvivirgaceae bacterium BMA12]|uniref:PAS domain S-box protein n=1 Tax=Agaribacillus aureus TaxID=3051825 RepID=A0ABT8L706_9BACT|nr:PAS domain S-box protein [Fulvivirgaceae bacterium BMA12]
MRKINIQKRLKLQSWLIGFILLSSTIFCWIIIGHVNYYLAIYTVFALAVYFVLNKKINLRLNSIYNSLLSFNKHSLDQEKYREAADSEPMATEILYGYQRVTEALENLNGIFETDNEFSFQNLKPEDPLRVIIEDIRKKLDLQKQEEDRRNWTIQGLANFGTLIRNEEHDLSNLGNLLISKLVEYTNCNQGAIFTIGAEEDGSQFLEQLSCYAYDRRRFGEKKVKVGVGLLGQCVLEKQTIYLKEVPDDYVYITSGLGFDTPRTLVILPLLANENVYGAVELASFEVLEDYKISFLEKLSESIALTIASQKHKSHTQKLLEESQKLSSELQEKEAAMQESFEKLASTQDEMHQHQMELDGLFRAINNYLVTAEIDMEGKVMGTNKNLLHLFEYKYEEVVGMSITRLLNDDKMLSSEFWERLASGKAVSQDHLCKTKAQIPFWLKVSFTPVENTKGEIYKVLMLAENITEEKLREAELQSHIQAIDKTIAAIEFNMEGNIRRINPIYAGIMGYKQDELAGKPYSVLLSQREKNNPQTALLWENLQRGQFFSGVFKQIDKQGKEQWLNGTLNPIFDVGGEPYKVMMFADFITGEKEKQNELQTLVNAMKGTFPYLEIDAGATFKSANKLFMELFGYKRLDLQKKDLSKLMTNASFKKFSKLIEKAAENRLDGESFEWVTKDGQTMPFQNILSPIKDLEDGLAKIALIFVENADSKAKEAVSDKA